MGKSINIISSSTETGDAWKQLIEGMFPDLTVRTYRSLELSSLSQEDLATSLWIIEVWNIYDSNYLNNPVGFRTALQLAENWPILLVFNMVWRDDFPEEGPFWITYDFKGSLKDKLSQIMNTHPQGKAPLEELLRKYPELGKVPKNTHH